MYHKRYHDNHPKGPNLKNQLGVITLIVAFIILSKGGNFLISHLTTIIITLAFITIIITTLINKFSTKKHTYPYHMEDLSPGEQEVADTLAQGLDYKNYFIFNNLIIPSTHNISSQIDHIVISKFGIFINDVV